MVKVVTLDNYPDCPLCHAHDEHPSACSITDTECYEKAPEDCPLRENYVVIRGQEAGESICQW